MAYFGVLVGIRYLRLSAKSLPKPEEIQALLYRT